MSHSLSPTTYHAPFSTHIMIRTRRSSHKNASAAINISESHGVRYLHFGSEWIQGAMRIQKPDAIELEYVQQMMLWMLFNDEPKKIAQLGLGTAALTKFCYKHFPHAYVDAVEINSAVIAVCRSMFKLPPDNARLNVFAMDAAEFVNDPSNRRQYDVLQVDLYDAQAQGPVLDSPEFYASCAKCLSEDGMMTVNLFGDHPSFGANLSAIRPSFDQVLTLPEIDAGNIVVIAFKKAPYLDYSNLYEKALSIFEATGLPARKWVSGLKSSNII